VPSYLYIFSQCAFDIDPVTVIERIVALNAEPLSFYTSAGAIDAAQITAHIQRIGTDGGRCIGWFRQRPPQPTGRADDLFSPPSLLEHAVTESMQAHLKSLYAAESLLPDCFQPCVFGLFSTSSAFTASVIGSEVFSVSHRFWNRVETAPAAADPVIDAAYADFDEGMRELELLSRPYANAAHASSSSASSSSSSSSSSSAPRASAYQGTGTFEPLFLRVINLGASTRDQYARIATTSMGAADALCAGKGDRFGCVHAVGLVVCLPVIAPWFCALHLYIILVCWACECALIRPVSISVYFSIRVTFSDIVKSSRAAASARWTVSPTLLNAYAPISHSKWCGYML
jgi:hypothetical protein